MTLETVHEDIKQTLGVVPDWIKEMPEGSAECFWSMTKNFWLAETTIPNKYKDLISST